MSGKNLPSVFDPDAAPARSLFGALARTRARLKEREETLRLEAEMAALAKIEQRFFRWNCAVTGQSWLIEWRKGPDDRLFQQHDRQLLKGDASAPASRSAKEASAFALADFNMVFFACPSCGDSRYTIKCSCGDLVCSGRTIDEGRGKRLFRCHDRCGNVFYLHSAALTVAGETAKRPQALRSASAREALPQPSKTEALSRPASGLLLPAPPAKKP